MRASTIFILASMLSVTVLWAGVPVTIQPTDWVGLPEKGKIKHNELSVEGGNKPMVSFLNFDMGFVRDASEIESIALVLPLRKVKGCGVVHLYWAASSWEGELSYGNRPMNGSRLASFYVDNKSAGTTIRVDLTEAFSKWQYLSENNHGILFETYDSLSAEFVKGLANKKFAKLASEIFDSKAPRFEMIFAPVGGPAGPQGKVGPMGPVGLQGVQGEKGDTGPIGATGPQGAIGATGATGATGAQGESGEIGPAGPQGEVGPVGPAGPEGIQGEKGETGPVGPAGVDGIKGETGAVGPQGETGPIGFTGPQGAIGATGAQGESGAIGPIGLQGEVGPVGPAGSEGIQGEIGETGPMGPAGVDGTKGETGAVGPQGETGPIGLTGPQGAIGATGPQGESGASGPIGPQGEVGPLGPAGPEGIQGEIGETGPMGPAGVDGIKGETGAVGPQGAIGATGATGPQGESGATGSIGPQGEVGPMGPAGPQGDQGEMGAIGATGPQGERGAVGPQGPAGASATDKSGVSALLARGKGFSMAMVNSSYTNIQGRTLTFMKSAGDTKLRVRYEDLMGTSMSSSAQVMASWRLTLNGSAVGGEKALFDYQEAGLHLEMTTYEWVLEGLPPGSYTLWVQGKVSGAPMLLHGYQGLNVDNYLEVLEVTP